MKHNVIVTFKDKATNLFIEHDDLTDGELTFNSWEDVGIIDALLKVNEIMFDEDVYQICARRFSVNKRKLYITVERIN